MTIEIEIKKEIITVILKKKGRAIQGDSFSLDNTLGEILLQKIDAILRKAKVSQKEIKRFKMKSEVDESYTSVRIIKTVINALNWSLERL